MTGHTFDLKTRVDIWKRIDVVTVGYGTLADIPHFVTWFFWPFTVITLMRDGVQWWNVVLFLILFLYMLPIDPFKCLLI